MLEIVLHRRCSLPSSAVSARTRARRHRTHNTDAADRLCECIEVRTSIKRLTYRRVEVEVLRILTPILGGVSTVHTRGLIHTVRLALCDLCIDLTRIHCRNIMRERVIALLIILLSHLVEDSTAATCYSNTYNDESSDNRYAQCSGACCVKVMV